MNENDTVKLICEVSKPNAEVTWFKGDEEVPDGARFEHISDGRKRVLLIHNAHPEDAGKYTCKLPSSSTTGKLTVHGKTVMLMALLSEQTNKIKQTVRVHNLVYSLHKQKHKIN